MWVGGLQPCGKDNIILMEVNSPLYKTATEFLGSIAEPVNRPDYIHEYKLTKYSLYAAASVGFDKEVIEKTLRLYCKNLDIPPAVREFVKEHCSSYGKAKLVLKNQQYFIEAVDHATIDTLKDFPAIAESIQNLY